MTMNQVDPAKLLKAAYFAAEKHRRQRRKDAESTPYVNHPLAVAKVLAVEADVKEENILIAALLHDIIEDTETTHEELTAQFGDEVSRIVKEVSDDPTLEKQKRKALQIEISPSLSIEAKMIRIADKVCNIRDILNMPPSNWSVERKMQYLQWTQKVVEGCRGTNAKLERIYYTTLNDGQKGVLENDASSR